MVTHWNACLTHHERIVRVESGSWKAATLKYIVKPALRMFSLELVLVRSTYVRIRLLPSKLGTEIDYQKSDVDMISFTLPVTTSIASFTTRSLLKTSQFTFVGFL